jgi:TolB-like protein/DNA-binding winged helix-turn-helix (wHTH) protein/tetratricopeptide (TPR) repeat protein
MSQAFFLGQWRVEPDRDRISKDGVDLNLRPQVMDLLVYFSQRPGKIVSSDEILAAIWEDRVTTQASVYNCVMELRHALGDDAHNPLYLETIPKRGYRLLAPVTPIVDELAAEDNQAANETGAGNGGEPWRRRLTRLSLTLVPALAMVALIAVLNWPVPDAVPRDPAMSAVSGPSIAVLPFTDLSPDAEHAYFADGFTEGILDSLAATPGLTVIARAASFRFRDSGEEHTVIAERLGVTHLLEGDIRRLDDRAWVSARLVAAADGTRLWASDYELDVKQIFHVQHAIANAVISAVGISFVVPDVGTAAELPAGAVDNRAYDHYLLARSLINQKRRVSLLEAIAILHDVVDQAPGLLPARLALIDSKLTLYWEHREIYGSGGGRPPREAEYQSFKLQLLKSADEIVAARPKWAKAHLVRGKILRVSGREAEADAALLAAIELNRNLADAYRHLGLNNNQRGGALSRTIGYLRRSLLVDPYSLDARMNLVRLLAGNPDNRDELWTIFRGGKSSFSWSPTLGETEGFLLACEGRLAEAVQVLEDTLDREESTRARGLLATLWYELGEKSRAWKLNPAEGLRSEEPDSEELPDSQRCSATPDAGDTAWAPQKAYTCVYQRDWERVLSNLGLEDSGPQGLLETFSRSWLGRPVSPAFSLALAHRMLGNHALSEEFADLEQQHLDIRWDQGRTNLPMYTQMTARLEALRGEEQQAVERLNAWIGLGQLSPEELLHPVYDPLRGSVDFQALHTRRVGLINIQREKLGLDPLPPFDVDCGTAQDCG